MASIERFALENSLDVYMVLQRGVLSNSAVCLPLEPAVYTQSTGMLVEIVFMRKYRETLCDFCAGLP